MVKSPLPLLVLGFMVLTCKPAAAITLGQVDNFQNLSPSGWVSGPVNPVQPAVISSGGPAGAGDAYLSITSTGGSGVGSRLVGINAEQWTGSFAAAGVTGITMDVANFGATALQLRLTFYGDGWVSNAVALPAGSGWQRVQFNIDASAVGTFSDLRLFHGFTNSASFPGPTVVAQLGVDNITAVPEPGAWALMGLGLLVLTARRRLAAALPGHAPADCDNADLRPA